MMKCRVTTLFLLFFLLTPTYATERVARGINYDEYFLSSTSKTIAHVLTIDPQKTIIYPAQARSGPPPRGTLLTLLDRLFFFMHPLSSFSTGFSRATVTELMQQEKAIGGVNGTYFSSGGTPLGILVINQEVVSYPLHERAALLLTGQGVAVDHLFVVGKCQIQEKVYEISGVNQSRAPNQLILFTPRFGDRTRTDGRGLEIVVRHNKVISQRMANSPIPPDGFVLSTSGELGQELSAMTMPGTPMQIDMQLHTLGSQDKFPIIHAVGGGPELLRAGQIYISKHEERFRQDIAQGRAARTAAGITQDGKLLLVTVDGKARWEEGAPQNAGATLEELANFLQSLGAWQALNLDGGGSSTMVVQGRIRNRLVAREERPVSNAIVVKSILAPAEE